MANSLVFTLALFSMVGNNKEFKINQSGLRMTLTMGLENF